MAKTYIPTLVYMLRRVCVYISRYGDVLRRYLTPEQQGYLDIIMETCTALTASIDDDPNP